MHIITWFLLFLVHIMLIMRIIVVISARFVFFKILGEYLKLPFLQFVLLNDGFFCLKVFTLRFKLALNLINISFKVGELWFQIFEMIVKIREHGLKVLKELINFGFHVIPNRGFKWGLNFWQKVRGFQSVDLNLRTFLLNLKDGVWYNGQNLLFMFTLLLRSVNNFIVSKDLCKALMQLE